MIGEIKARIEEIETDTGFDTMVQVIPKVNDKIVIPINKEVFICNVVGIYHVFDSDGVFSKIHILSKKVIEKM